MIRSITSLYGAILKGLVVLVTAGAISAACMEKAAKKACQSLPKGLVSLKMLNARLGM
ncbi:MAG: hypothetical protein WCI18_02980 [Pseudomonadota bacterium]